jgi:ATPase family AAA domain-containing protein 2
MAKRKYAIEGFDPNESDVEDESYEEGSPARAPGKRPSRGQTSRKKQHRTAPPRKRKRISDSDIVDDDDSLIEDSSAQYDDEESDEQIEKNNNGRPRRSAAKAAVKYEEPSDEDLESGDNTSTDDDADNEDEAVPRRKRKTGKLLLKLKVPPGALRNSSPAPAPPTRRSTRQASATARAMSRGASAKPTSSRPDTAQSQQEPLVQLTTSGKHMQTQPGQRSHSPEEPSPRLTYGGKGIKRPPTTIMEASLETSSKEILTQESAAQVEDSNASGSQALSAAGPSQVAVERSIEEEAEEEEEDEEEDDDDDVPVPGKQRSRRASLSSHFCVSYFANVLLRLADSRSLRRP